MQLAESFYYRGRWKNLKQLALILMYELLKIELHARWVYNRVQVNSFHINHLRGQTTNNDAVHWIWVKSFKRGFLYSNWNVFGKMTQKIPKISVETKTLVNFMSLSFAPRLYIFKPWFVEDVKLTTREHILARVLVSVFYMQ